MAGRLAGKRTIVTAAAQGIGRASAEAFAREGAHVIATDINVDPLATFTGGEALRLDVTDAAAVQALVDRAGPVDVLFNCAGWVHHGTILECDEAAWDRSLTINAKAMFYAIRAVLPGMLARGRGSIVNMSSIASSVRGVPNRFAYCTSKAAVIGLTRSVALDFIGRGIRCNAICPGTVDSPVGEDGRGGARSVPGAPADGPAGSPGGDRGARPLPRVGRIGVHDGHGQSGGWGLVELKREDVGRRK
jgi:2-keto-3-deoxy-L-fuconate dehydrogenase